MYTRYPNYRFGSRVKIPENYSGNAFSSDAAEAEAGESLPNDAEPKEERGSELALNAVSEDMGEKTEEVGIVKQSEKRIKLPSFRFDLGKLFSGGFGFEELLIIALILLISEGDSDDDMILLLALLLFIK